MGGALSRQAPLPCQRKEPVDIKMGLKMSGECIKGSFDGSAVGI